MSTSIVASTQGTEESHLAAFLVKYLYCTPLSDFFGDSSNLKIKLHTCNHVMIKSTINRHTKLFARAVV